jgi:WD40 repeat protein
VVWSVRGRYAIAAISSKIDTEKNLIKSYIKVWDSVTHQVIPDLSKPNGLYLQTCSLVLAPHPHIEEILLTGSDGGVLALWNIKTRQLVKKFIEYGVYSIDSYQLNNPFDGKFSPDGSSFVIGSYLGTVSLFSNDGATHKY